MLFFLKIKIGFVYLLQNVILNNMKRFLKVIVVGFIAFVFSLYLVGGSLLNKSIKTGLETVAPDILGVPLNIDTVDISLLDGRGSIERLVIGNPEGFKTDNLFSVNFVELDLSIMSLFSGIVHIESIQVETPKFIFERNIQGSNLGILLERLKSQGNREASSISGEDSSNQSDLKFRVDACSIKNGSVQLNLGASAELPMPNLVIENIGTEGGISAKDAIAEILGSVLRNVVKTAVNNPSQILNLGSELILDGENSVVDVLEGVKGLFGK